MPFFSAPDDPLQSDKSRSSQSMVGARWIFTGRTRLRVADGNFWLCSNHGGWCIRPPLVEVGQDLEAPSSERPELGQLRGRQPGQKHEHERSAYRIVTR